MDDYEWCELCEERIDKEEAEDFGGLCEPCWRAEVAEAQGEIR